MNTSDDPRKTIARNPSHLGSNRNPAPAGTSSASLASIGSTGGAIIERTTAQFATLEKPLVQVLEKIPGDQPVNMDGRPRTFGDRVSAIGIFHHVERLAELDQPVHHTFGSL